MPAKWSAFFSGLDETDRLALQRTREVVGLSVRGKYTRVDFRNKWARKDVVFRLGQFIEGQRAAGNLEAAVLEADVNPLRRFMSDHGTVSVSATPRIAWFDLETDSRCSFFDAVENGRARILCWSLTTLEDGTARTIATGILEADTDLAERALIEELLVACRDYDVLCAWSGSGFDFPVLEKRASALRARPNGRPPCWQRWCFLDCLEVLKKYNAHGHESGEEKTSFKLNAIAQALLGEGKKDFDVVRTWESWAAGGEERMRLLEYNVQDALLMPKIEAKTGYIALHIAVCAVTRCFPDDSSLKATQQADGFLLRLGEIHNYRWPTKQHVENPGEYPGAFVMEPSLTGIVENVHVADFASLYPSIIRSWNISPETVLYKLQTDPEAGSSRLPYTELVKFSNARRGMLPLALDELVMRRSEYSRKQDAAEPGSSQWERYKRLSGAYKIVANSFYGVMGSSYTRYFSSTAAEAVTQTGAWLIKHVGAVSSTVGLHMLYGDTDSCFVTGDYETFNQVVVDLNASWGSLVKDLGCQNCFVKLEFEKSFSRIVLVSKKRYIGRYQVYKGKPVAVRKIEIKGLEYKRGDTLKLARDMQKELIDLLLGDEVPKLDVVRAFVAKWKTRILEEPLTIEDIVVSQSVKNLDEYAERFTTARCSGAAKKMKCSYTYSSTSVRSDSLTKCPRCGTERKRQTQPAHVRVAKILAERGEEIRSGTRVEYLIVSDEGQSVDPIPARDPGALERISRMYYWLHRIYPGVARVLESAFPGAGWTETSAEKRQRRKAAAIERNRGVIDDLPLFAPERLQLRMRVKSV